VTKPSSTAYIAKLDGRKEYYKLTSHGLFCVLKEIQREDIGNIFAKPDFENRVFEIYKDDPLFEIFLNHDLIDMAVMAEIKSYDVMWIFADYLKSICQEINKELEFFADFQKNGVRSGTEVKWKQNLNKMNKSKWKGFIDRLFDNIIITPSFDDKNLKPSDLVVDLHISDKICSFSYDNKKYSIEIEEIGTKNNKTINAKYCINDKEYFKLYDPDKVKQYTVKFNEIAVEKRKHCFVLKKIHRDPETYINSSIRRFIYPLRLLRTQLGYSILQLFPDTFAVSLGSHLTDDFKKHLIDQNSELAILASDSKIRRLVTDDLYKEIDKKYHTFLKFIQ
jgi:hypothetical protein